VSDHTDKWIATLLSDIASIQMGQSPDSRSYNNREEGLPFFQGKAEFGKLFPTARKWCTDPKKIAEAGDILLSVRAPVGPTNLATEKCCIGRGLSAIQAYAPFDQKYLLYYFRNIQIWLAEQGTGTTFSAIGGDFIRKLEIPLAPLNEQKRIADKLDRLLAKVDACRERCDRIPLILKRFRQSVLAAATSGELTEDWEDDHKQWQTFTLGSILSDIRYGTAKKSFYEVKNGTPVLRIPNIGDGYISSADLKFGEFNKKEIETLSLRTGDLLLIRSNGSVELVGKVALVEPEFEGYMFAGYLIRLRLNTSVA
jgi:type I restriction enzyme, S subunit